MIYVSHRGNIDGPKPNFENHPDYIDVALKYGYDVEVDVWYIDSKWYLGHDEPIYMVDEDFIKKDGLWLHAKNIESLYELNKSKLIYFWHQNDDYTLTSNGYIWTYPGKELTDRSICVLPEMHKDIKVDGVYGICSDYVKKYE